MTLHSAVGALHGLASSCCLPRVVCLAAPAWRPSGGQSGHACRPFHRALAFSFWHGALRFAVCTYRPRCFGCCRSLRLLSAPYHVSRPFRTEGFTVFTTSLHGKGVTCLADLRLAFIAQGHLTAGYQSARAEGMRMRRVRMQRRLRPGADLGIAVPGEGGQKCGLIHGSEFQVGGGVAIYRVASRRAYPAGRHSLRSSTGIFALEHGSRYT